MTTSLGRTAYLLTSLLTVFALSSCALFEESNEKPSHRQVKDVSPKARKDDQGPRKRLLVMPFLDVDETRPERFRMKSREEVIKELNKQGMILAMSGDDLKFSPKQYLQQGEYNFQNLGKGLFDQGISAALEGRIVELKVKHKSDEVGIFRQMKTRFDAVVRVRIAAARSGRELLNTTKTVTLEEANLRVPENVTTESLIRSNPELLEKLISDAFLDFIPQITASLERMSWEGRIALVKGEEIFLNVGRMSGVQVGDILKVTEEGEEVFDPQTGNFIGKTPGRMKGTLEVVTYFGNDGAKAVVHSGAGFKENDRVELY